MSIDRKKDEIEHEEVGVEGFKKAIKDILLAKSEGKEPLEKRMPTREELDKKWKLEQEEKD